jgi:hypothetical protein
MARRSKTGGGAGTNQHMVKGKSKLDQLAEDIAAQHAALAAVNAKAGLGGLAEEPPPPSTPTVKVRNRFDLGEPVATKADWLETEIGRVDFTEDLVLGFDDDPSPQSTEEAWALMVEAADRYARLTAFIAAEQGLTCDELNQMYTRWGEQNKLPHPKDIQGAVQRATGESSATGDALADKVVYALDGSAKEDPEIILAAAAGYAKIMKNNKELSVHSSSGSPEYNLETAIEIHKYDKYGETMWNSDPRHDIHNEQYCVNSEVPYADKILERVDPAVLETLDNTFDRPQGLPQVEKFPAGIRINLTAETSLEISEVQDDTAQEPGKMYTWGHIKRIKTTNGKRLVVSQGEFWGRTSGTAELVLAAADFTRPMSIGWEPNSMVGFKNRNQTN